MVILSAAGLTKAYGADIILNNVSFSINKGDRIGIIGNNGAGKTTLISVLAGELSAESGDFYISNNITIGFLKQHDDFNSEKTVYEEMLSVFSELLTIEKKLEIMSKEISERSDAGEDVEALLHQYDELSEYFKSNNGYGFRGELHGILASMAFPEDSYSKKISSLSGGERTRLALASLLLRKPDLLLLDEPTNHLDIGTLKWLEQYLKNYTGTIAVISHDRYFLDQTVNRIFEIDNHKLSVYEGNYSTYLEKKKRLTEDAIRRYEQQRREIERQEEIIRRFKQHGTEKLVKRAQSREKRLEHIERLERPDTKKGHIKISFKENFKSGTDVLFCRNLSKSFGEGKNKRLLFRNVEFDIKRGERICIVGPNGIGKTTLLKIIMGLLLPDTGNINVGHNVVFGYYDQGQKSLNDVNTVLEELHEAYRLYNETELRSLLGRFLFQKDDVFKKVGDLSGGEKARLALLKLMMSGANVLVMDEPTNHLDIAAKEVFEDSLLDFAGTLILVSHDRYLLNKVPTRIFELSENGMESFLGSYDYYVEKKQSISSGKGYLEDLSKMTGSALTSENSNSALSSKQQRMEERQRNKELDAKRKKRERELASVESDIAELEAEIRKLEAEMCSDEVISDYSLLAAYADKLEAAKSALEASYGRWMELQ